MPAKKGYTMVCVFCETETFSSLSCSFCGEYKGMMEISEWEIYTGETWEG